MRLYDSLRQEPVELHTPDGVMRMYVCGITPYDTTHMGHARTYLVFDVLARVLEHQGYAVNYVQNVTDIDDDILRKAKQVGLTWDELGRRETERFLRDLDSLNIRRPNHYVKATETIDTMLQIITTLIERGLAYERNGNVYFDVSADPGFGELGHMGYDEMLATANERGNNPTDPHKDDPLDFVLWQAAQPGEPTWDSPWGAGRPGWHIECSAMAMQYLGPQLQVHGGGADLQFPHHAAEIAQSENASGQRPFSQAWAHIGMVRLDGEKMSKSLGNLVFAAKELEQFSSDAIRLALLSYQYCEGFEYTSQDVVQAEALVEQLRAALAHTPAAPGTISAAELRQQALAALDTDLNTPETINLLGQLAAATLHNTIDDAEQAKAALREISGVLGLRLAGPSTK